MNKTARHSLLIAGLASCAFGTQAFADNEAYTLGQIEVAGSRQADVAEKSTTVSVSYTHLTLPTTPYV